MSTYLGKLLELKSIEKKLDAYFLNVQLSFEQDTEMLWQIDDYTAEKLKAITTFDEKHKYRLSFNSSHDFNQDQYASILAKTYRDCSEPLYFHCTKDYIDNLTAIKHIQHIDELDESVFTIKNLEPANAQIETVKALHEDSAHNNYVSRSSLKLIAAFAMISILLFSYVSFTFFNKISFDKKVLAQSIQQYNEVEEPVLPIKLNNGAEEQNPIQIIKLNNEFHTEQDKSLQLYVDNSDENVVIEEDTPKKDDIPSFDLEEVVTYSIPKGYVALTFDDGPSKYSLEIMEILEEYKVGGTFFFIGSNAEKFPDYVKHIKTNGYSIGSHSMSHPNMATLSSEEQENELIQSMNLLKEITNEEIMLFRPPYGSYKKELKDLFDGDNYKMVLWNNDPEDWSTRNPDIVFKNIKNTNVSGSIIILHESQAVVDALPSIIEYLQELELKIVSLK
ncbi:MAG: polysaccharide deacetylase family protein [Tissierellales bacterium]